MMPPPKSFMPYAILQKELIAPSVEQLTQACRVLPSLTAIDAQTMFHDAYGILMRGMDLLDASALQDALQIESVETIVIEETELPVMPPAKVIRQIDFLPNYLTMYDPMGRSFTLPAHDVMFIAAGDVRIHEYKRVKSGPEESQLSSTGQTNSHLMLEIFLVGGVSRYSIAAEDFAFGYLGGRITESLSHNFGLLVQDLAQFAPHAGLNRGAFLLCENAEELFTYPNKPAFYEEMTWMLWRISQSGYAEPPQ